MKSALIASAATILLTTFTTAERIDESFLRAPPQADVILIGERHDNPDHHAAQAMAVAAVEPSALVFEMLTPQEASRAAPEVRDNRVRLEVALGWSESGWPDFALYYPIFTAAPDAAIYGAAITRSDASRAGEQGPAAVLGPSAPLFGLDVPLGDEEQDQREAEQLSAHCDAIPEVALPSMVDVQRLRDAALARAAIVAHAETGGPVVVITGNGHARTDRGVPRMLARAAPGLSILSIGQLERTREGSEPPPFDYWRITQPADRGDPCAAFR